MTIDDFCGKSYIKLSPYDEPPKFTDFVVGQNRTIRLINNNTGEVETITFCFSGYSMKYPNSEGYQSFWGDVKNEGWPNCCLVFNYEQDGTCYLITLSLCGKSASDETFQEMTKDSKYPADFNNKPYFFNSN